MTLCIAWVQNGSVHLITDSRISAGPHSDEAVKISEVYFTIRNPADNSTWKSTIGVAYSGSTSLASSVRDRFAVLLSQSAINPFNGDFSMDTLSDFGAQIHDMILKSFVRAWGEEERMHANIILAGFCPRQNRGRAFRIHFDAALGNSVASEIENGIHFYGDGGPAAERLRDRIRNPYTIMLNVIQDATPDAEKVGGNPQVGIVECGRFVVKGIMIPGNQSNKYVLAGSEVSFDRGIIPEAAFLAPFGLG